MVIEACECNWGIPGVEALPPHTHIGDGGVIPYEGRKGAFNLTYEDFQARYNPLRGEIRIWVPWSRVARELSSDR